MWAFQNEVRPEWEFKPPALKQQFIQKWVCWKCTYPRPIQDVDEFWRNVASLAHQWTVLPSLPTELGYFYTVAAGCFSCLRVEATPITWFLAPGMWILPGGVLPKKHVFYPWNAIFTGRVLSSNFGRVLLWKPGNPCKPCNLCSKVQTADKNITVIHTSLQSINYLSWEVKTVCKKQMHH